jgi:hypothetical protein
METFTTQESGAQQDAVFELVALCELSEMQLLLVGGGSADVFCQ